MIPQQTPVNQKQKQKLAPYKMHAPSLFPGPKPNHLISLCLIEWLVWKYVLLSYYVLLVHVQLSPGNPAVFYKMAWLTRKKSLQNASVCDKNAPGMEHGSSHFIVEIHTGIDFWDTICNYQFG